MDDVRAPSGFIFAQCVKSKKNFWKCLDTTCQANAFVLQMCLLHDSYSMNTGCVMKGRMFDNPNVEMPSPVKVPRYA